MHRIKWKLPSPNSTTLKLYRFPLRCVIVSVASVARDFLTTTTNCTIELPRISMRATYSSAAARLTRRSLFAQSHKCQIPLLNALTHVGIGSAVGAYAGHFVKPEDKQFNINVDRCGRSMCPCLLSCVIFTRTHTHAGAYFVSIICEVLNMAYRCWFIVSLCDSCACNVFFFACLCPRSLARLLHSQIHQMPMNWTI